MVAKNVTLKEGSAEASQQLAEAQAEIDSLKEVVKVTVKSLKLFYSENYCLKVLKALFNDKEKCGKIDIFF